MMTINRLARLAAAALMVGTMTGTEAQAATIYAKAVDWSGDTTGFVTKAANSDNRSDPGNALGAPEPATTKTGFLSLGLKGWAVFDFGELFATAGVLYEITFDGGGTGKGTETAAVYFSNSPYTPGGTGTAIPAGFGSPMTSVPNNQAQNGFGFAIANGPFRYLLVQDTTKGTFGDGFDVNAVGVSAVPLPAGAALLVTAMGGLAVARRLRKTA